MKILKKMLLALLVLFMVVSCGTKQDDSATGSDDTKKVIFAMNSDVQSLDSSVATDGTSFTAISTVIAGLVRLDENDQVVPEIAESWTVSEDGTVYTFTLSEDAKWSNGDPVTANDFVYGFRRLVDPATASEYNFIYQVVRMKNASEVISGEKPLEDLGVKAIDDKTLEITLDGPVNFFLSLMAFPTFFPLNQAFVEECGDKYATAPEYYLSNGSFTLKSWTQGNSLVFEKNADYIHADEISLDELEMKIIKDPQSAILAYESGQVDITPLTGELVDAYKGTAGYTERLAGYLWYLPLNTEVEELNNLNLRKAISLSIDRDKVANNVLKDGSIAAKGIVPTRLAVSSDNVDFREDSGNLVSTDYAKAAEYFELAKQELGVDSIEIEFLFEDSEASKSVAEFIQSELETHLDGLVIKLKSQPKKARLQLMREGDFEMVLHRWGPDYADPQTYLELFVTGTNYNYSKFSNPEYDELAESCFYGELATQPEARWDAMKELEKMLVVDAVTDIPVYQNGGAVMVKENVKNIQFHTVSVDMYNRITIE